MTLRKLLVPAIVAGVAGLAQAEIDYKVTVDPQNHQLQIHMLIPAEKGPVSVQMPSWMPGAYTYGNFYENVHDVIAKDVDGSATDVGHPDKNTWRVTATGKGVIDLSYTVPSNGRRFGGGAPDSGYLQISGPTAYMYVVGRKNEKCKITFEVPDKWPVVLGLDEDKGGQPNTYVAPSYDVLADAPVSTGSDIIVDKYTLRGKDHYVVLEGAAKNQVDKARLMKDCRFVSAAETDFWGSVPYHKYVWHFIVFPGADGAGGLEHLSSTQISLSSGEGPRAQSVLSHEYFHLWNVKRIRAKVLGPFDYLTLPKTGALWWLEGVTDYYAGLIPYRYGEWKRDQFFDDVTRNVTAVRSNPARLTVSPYQASYRVGDANNGRGNSNGYEISYYNLGWLAGMCLDIEIRQQTNGKHSLDDVARALYDLCKDNKPGFEEDEIRKQCIRFGGPSLGPFYDKVVMSPGELPVEEQLAKAGLKMDEHDEPMVDVGFAAAPSRQGGGVRFARIHGPADGKIMTGDVLVAMNGKSLQGMDPRGVASVIAPVIQGAAVGTPITLTVSRGGQNVDVTIDPVMSSRKVKTISDDPAATPAQIALRDGWLYTKLPSVQ
ncbi:MAG TPA: hypothetical protein VGL56_03350 [Fimbriimonadaceae bacterium]|jgi:predicted metalloprotease with PDZ domain